ncbi:MAG TPA: hypothetical protein VES39_06965 [Rhodospirillales bacterium]|nr:hypothetical protein [Rhodospirillales bacterium]
MLAHLNVIILSLWLVAEVVPLLADNLAGIERRHANSKKND